MSSNPPPIGAEHIDYRGTRSILGRTSDAYAIWDAATGGPPLQTFPLNNEGWAAAWTRFQELEGGGPFQPGGLERGTIAPLGLGRILSGTFEVFGRNFGALALMVVAVMVPIGLLQVFIFMALLGPELELVFSGAISATELELYGQIIEDRLPAFIVVAIAFFVVYLFVQSFLTAALLRGGLQGFRGGRPRAGELLRASVSRTPSMAWILFLTALAIIGITIPAVLVVPLFSPESLQALGVVVLILLLLLLLLFYTRFLLAPAALIAEGARGTAAIRRSWELTRSRIWPIFGTFFLVGLMAAIANFVISLPFQAIAQEQTTLSTFWLFSSIGAALGTALVLPFTTVAIVHLYIDARARKEPLDPVSLDPEPAPSTS